ncbi:MAG: hypothetical protein L6R39_000749 [Caloplaca ligustica]|nr:MAG: hypothetical protein L6R39_000749 [Caloplaca ligustica]
MDTETIPRVTESTPNTPAEFTTGNPTGPTPNTSAEPASSTFAEPIPGTPAEHPSSKSMRKQLTRDQRLQIHTLRKAGHSHEFIVNFFKPEKVTYRQVAYACTAPVDPQNHRCGAKPKLNSETRHKVKELMEKSTGPRPITYKEVSAQLGLEGISQSTLRRARVSHCDCSILHPLITVGYEDIGRSDRPYQYDKKKTIRPPPTKKGKTHSTPARPTVSGPPPPVTSSQENHPGSDVPADLAASWTAALQNSIRSHGTQPA